MLSRHLGRSCLIFNKIISKRHSISTNHLSCNKNLNDAIESSFKQQLSPHPALPISVSQVSVASQTNEELNSGPHLLDAIATLFKTFMMVSQKNDEEFMRVYRMDCMKKIHSILEANIDKLSGSEALRLLEVLHKMKIPVTFIDYPDILQHLNKHIDRLSFGEICQLLHILHKMPVHTPLKQTIQKNLQPKFKAQLLSNSHDDNIECLENAISVVVQQFKNVEYRQLLDTIMKKLWRYAGDIPIENAVGIFKSLCNLRYYPREWICLLQKIQSEMEKQSHSLKKNQIILLFQLAAWKEKHYNGRINHFYNEELTDQLIQKAINDDVDVRGSLQILGHVTQLRHKSHDLLNFSSAAFVENSCLNRGHIQERISQLVTLITGFALARFRPVFWKDIQSSILSNHEILNWPQQTLIILAANLVALNCYPIRILERIFSQLHDFSSQQYLGWTFTKIYQKLKSDHNYNGPMPSNLQVENLKLMSQKQHNARIDTKHQLLEYLQKGVEEPKYIKSNVVTRLSHLIDHVVAFEKSGSLVPISKSNPSDGICNQFDLEYFEDLVVPPDCLMVPIVYIPYSWCFRNTNELTGLHQTAIDALESISLNVVLIKETTWWNIPDAEKTSFLMNEIQSNSMSSANYTNI